MDRSRGRRDRHRRRSGLVGDPASPHRTSCRRASGPSTTAPSSAPATSRPQRPNCATAGAATTSSSCARSLRSPARATWTRGRAPGRVRRRSRRRAVDDADRLIQSVMRDRGYPVEDFDDRASLVSVDHPIVVERYRRAHASRSRTRAATRRPRACGARCRTTARSSSSSSRTPTTATAARDARSGFEAARRLPRKVPRGGRRWPGSGADHQPLNPRGRALKAPSGVRKPAPAR